MSWTDQKIERLRELCTRPLSATAIAFELNSEFNASFTRSAIIGKANRLHIALPFHGRCRTADPDRPRRGRKPAANRQRAAHIRVHVSARTGAWDGVAAIRCDPIAAVETDDGAPIGGGVTFDQLTPDCCRWPFGDPRNGMRYCGQKRVAGDTYWFCAAHLRRAWSRSAAA